MKPARAILRIAFLAALTLGALSLPFTLRRGVETDLMSLTGLARNAGLRDAAAASDSAACVLIEGADPESLREPVAAAVAVFGETRQLKADELLALVARHSAGLMTPETRRQIDAGETGAVAEAAMSRLFGPVPPLISASRDPFLLASEYFESLSADFMHGWSLRDGCLHRSADGREYALVRVPVEQATSAQLLELKRRGEQTVLEDAAVKVWCVGSVFHAAEATADSKREINVLSAVSLVLVVLLGTRLFGSLRFVVPLVLAQVCAFTAATAALFAVFERPHVLTFVFGTSLIGLSVDYVYHALAERDRVIRPMVCSMLTTVACLCPLLFSSVPALRQMALFTIVGIFAVFGCATLFVRPIGTTVVPPRPPRAGLRALLVAGRLAWYAACIGACIVAKPSCSPADLYRPDAYLASGESKFLQLSGSGNTRMALTYGATLQEALEHEERAGVKGVSTVVPSLKRQRENLEAKARLYAEAGSQYAAATGLKVEPLDPSAVDEAELLDPESPDCASLRTLLLNGWTGRCTVTSVDDSFVSDDPAVRVYLVRDALENLLARLSIETARLMMWSALVFALILAVLFRRRFLVYFLPVAIGVSGSFVALAVTRQPMTFFSLVSGFVVMGLGVDYTIFYRSENADPTMRRTVFYSFLTSFVGLGALAFTHFAVTRSMGVSFAGGLLASYLAARFSGVGRVGAASGKAAVKS